MQEAPRLPYLIIFQYPEETAELTAWQSDLALIEEIEKVLAGYRRDDRNRSCELHDVFETVARAGKELPQSIKDARRTLTSLLDEELKDAEKALHELIYFNHISVDPATIRRIPATAEHPNGIAVTISEKDLETLKADDRFVSCAFQPARQSIAVTRNQESYVPPMLAFG